MNINKGLTEISSKSECHLLIDPTIYTTVPLEDMVDHLG